MVLSHLKNIGSLVKSHLGIWFIEKKIFFPEE